MIALLLMLLMHASASPTADMRGKWINDRQTAIISVADCQTGLCGTIIWSATAARRDAARGGTADLNGTIVLFGFAPDSPNRWRGKLFLPDHNRIVTATVELQANGTLRVRGCDLGGLICRSQKWARWPAN